MYGFIITPAGRKLLAGLLAGEKLIYTRVMVGEGMPPEDFDPLTLTDLIQPVAAATSTIPLVEGNQCSMTIEFRNENLSRGFNLTEYCVYAEDPESGGEVALFIGALYDFPEPVPPYTGGAGVVRQYPVVLYITDGAEVEINYCAEAFMTADDVAEYVRVTASPAVLDNARVLIAEHSGDPEAHPDIRAANAEQAGRIQRLEDMVLNDITGNQYAVTFGDMTGLVVTGVWNTALQRVEF